MTRYGYRTGRVTAKDEGNVEVEVDERAAAGKRKGTRTTKDERRQPSFLSGGINYLHNPFLRTTFDAFVPISFSYYNLLVSAILHTYTPPAHGNCIMLLSLYYFVFLDSFTRQLIPASHSPDAKYHLSCQYARYVHRNTCIYSHTPDL